MRDLETRTAIVTGASRGIGPYICRALAKRGMNIVLVARDAEALTAVAEELGKRGTKTCVVPADLADPAAAAEIARRATETFGAVDVLVNNAGIEQASHFHELAAADIARMVAVNLTGPMLLTRAVLPGMVDRGRGHIVNVASLAGKSPVPYNAVYAATKAGLLGFTHSLHAELHGAGVGASSVSPGFVSEAGMFHDSQQLSGATALRFVGRSTPAKVAAAIVSAIEKNRVDVIVNSVPMRPVFALAAVAPGTIQRLLPAFGVSKTMRQVADANRKKADDS